MSLFGSMMRDFDDDPFFSSAHQDHMRRMEHMMSSFMDPFESMFGNMNEMMGLPRLMPPNNPVRPSEMRREDQGLMPFGFGHQFGFPSMRNLFHNIENMTGDPNCHSYSASSVMTYSTGEDGRPKVYQAAASTRKAPGGVKETRRTVMDSEAGVRKMAIGHHLGDQAHIVEKTKFTANNQEEQNEEFVNLDETEAENFNRQWQRKIQPQPVMIEEAPATFAARTRRRNDDEKMRALPSTSKKRDSEEEKGGDKLRRKHLKNKEPKHE